MFRQVVITRDKVRLLLVTYFINMKKKTGKIYTKLSLLTSTE